MRPPRRYPELVGILPAQKRLIDKPRILTIVDTSGSVTTELLRKIDENLHTLGRDYDITIVECGAVIHRIYPYKKLDDTFQGRGGTDLRPPLEESFLRKQKADLVIFFTDGYGPAPPKAPMKPMI